MTTENKLKVCIAFLESVANYNWFDLLFRIKPIIENLLTIIKQKE